jgi:hypothetical protein
MPGPGIKAGTPIIGSRSSILPFCHNSPSFELEKAKEVVVCKRLAHTRPEESRCANPAIKSRLAYHSRENCTNWEFGSKCQLGNGGREIGETARACETVKLSNVEYFGF